MGSMTKSASDLTVNEEDENKNCTKQHNGKPHLVEHLATFGYGEKFGVFAPTDALNKLTEYELAGSVFPQKVMIRFTDDKVVIDQENTDEMIEEFPLKLVSHPFAYVSPDPKEMFNNLLVFVVNTDPAKSVPSYSEMHVFQCVSESANDILEIFENCLDKYYKKEKLSNTRPTAFKKHNRTGTPKSSVVTLPGSLPNSDSFPKSNSFPKSGSLNSSASAPAVEIMTPKDSLSSSDSSDTPEIIITEIPFVVDQRRSLVYVVEHLATFKYGEKFGIINVHSGVEKLKEIEKSNGVWVQKMTLRVDDEAIVLKTNDKKRWAKFHKERLRHPHAYYSSKSNDIYNNLLLFVVKSNEIQPSSSELHIFQCVSHPAREIVQNLLD